MSTRSYHHGHLRSALLERAEQTVMERGVHALSLRELARDVGVSHGAPRRHFPDRQALLDALAEDGFERLGTELDDAVQGLAPGLGFDARLQALAHAYVGFATRHTALLELMFARKHRDGAEGAQAAAERSLATPLAVIAAAQQAGELVLGDAGPVARVVFATLQGLAAMANGGMLEGDDVDAVVTDAIEQLLSGLRPR